MKIAPPDFGDKLARLRSRSSGVTNEIGFQMGVALVQRLQSEPPAVELDVQLIDIAADLGSLRFVLY